MLGQSLGQSLVHIFFLQMAAAPLGGGASSSSGGDAASSSNGRPMEHDMQEDDLRLACEAGLTAHEITQETGLSRRQIDRLKEKWGLQGVAQAHRSLMPTFQQLRQWWDDDPDINVDHVAQFIGVSSRGLRKYCRRIGFDTTPLSFVPDAVVVDALLQLQQGPCSDLGITFAAARLKREFDIVPTTRQLRRCLKLVNPAAHQARATAAAATRYIYTVAGPRSLYHCDAHEKLAKIWGFWLHLCIDGYSRFIIYLTAMSSKRADAVGQLFVQA